MLKLMDWSFQGALAYYQRAPCTASMGRTRLYTHLLKKKRFQNPHLRQMKLKLMQLQEESKYLFSGVTKPLKLLVSGTGRYT